MSARFCAKLLSLSPSPPPFGAQSVIVGGVRLDQRKCEGIWGLLFGIDGKRLGIIL